MADRVKKVRYCYVTVPNRSGRGAEVLATLKDAGVNLQAFSGFPVKGGKSQLDLIVDRTGPVSRLARRHGWKLSKVKRGFLIQGKDQVGAGHRHIARLADHKINVIAADAVAAGQGRFGMILWVKPGDYNRAAKALRAR